MEIQLVSEAPSTPVFPLSREGFQEFSSATLLCREVLEDESEVLHLELSLDEQGEG